ncbi:hypothetical protein Lal_00011550 [Lupinus albus]|uniref:Uncharacterized protein n=1 Tax=Lupinus albus TaxID=3870 RepID=A0A6A4QE39_LUPAL|nr:hypothetical protein Lalb_Chr06g0165841 [Lupinus albus]KAF1880492.1 hypothetical protein Lal_00011550 [Lupinus albus]
MVRQWKEMGYRGDEGTGGSSYGDELRRVVFVLWVAFVSLSFLVAIIFCADGMSKKRASPADNYGHGSACEAGCGGGCGA